MAGTWVSGCFRGDFPLDAFLLFRAPFRLVVVLRAIQVATFIAVGTWLTNLMLAPQLINLANDLPMKHAHEIGTGIAFMFFFFPVVFKAYQVKGGGVAMNLAVIVLTGVIALARVKVVNEELARTEAVYIAEQTAFEAAKENRNAAIREASSDPDLNARAPYLNRKREARANLAKARAMPIPTQPVAPETGLDVWLVQVVVPVGMEFVSAILVKYWGSVCGALFARLTAPIWRRREEEEESSAGYPGCSPCHPFLAGVDLDRLTEDALNGLDIVSGTWRGVPLGAPAIKGKGRDAMLWPTLDVNSERNVFIGSAPARDRAARAHLRVLPASSAEQPAMK